MEWASEGLGTVVGGSWLPAHYTLPTTGGACWYVLYAAPSSTMNSEACTIVTRSTNVLRLRLMRSSRSVSTNCHWRQGESEWHAMLACEQRYQRGPNVMCSVRAVQRGGCAAWGLCRHSAPHLLLLIFGLLRGGVVGHLNVHSQSGSPANDHDREAEIRCILKP